MPNFLLRRKYDATFALWMMFLLGRHAMLGHDPPIYFRSTTATRFSSAANVHAAIVDPVPPPRITRSNCSGRICLLLRTAGISLLLSMRFFLSVSIRELSRHGRQQFTPTATDRRPPCRMCQRSRMTFASGSEQHTSTFPAVGLSSGSG